jgi:hypothetical protein
MSDSSQTFPKDNKTQGSAPLTVGQLPKGVHLLPTGGLEERFIPRPNWNEYFLTAYKQLKSIWRTQQCPQH